MTPEKEAEILVRSDPVVWMETCSTILNRAGRLITPVTNSFQRRVVAIYRYCRAAGIPCRIIILKPRRKGSSTVSLGIGYTHLRNHLGNGAVLGDDLGTTAKLMECWDRYVEKDRFRFWGNTATQTKREFSHGSKVDEETANDPRAGMGGDIHFLLASEAAHYRSKGKTSGEYVMQSIMNSVPDLPDTVVIMESTPNGAQGVFYQSWQAAVEFDDFRAGKVGNGYIRVFAPWFEFDDSVAALAPGEAESIMESLDNESRYQGERELVALYGVTAGNLKWRRQIIDSPACNGDPRKFMQEYPSDPVTCIAGSCRVGTSRGIIPIAQVSSGLRSDHGTVMATQNNGIRSVITLQTSLGYQVICTPDHLIATPDGRFQRADTMLGRPIMLQPPTMADNLHVVRWIGYAGIVHELTITEEWGRFLGYFMGDGSIYNGCVEFACDAQDRDVIDDVRTLVTKFLGEPSEKVSGSKKGCRVISVSRKANKELFGRMGWAEENNQHQRRRVCVPDCIWRSPRSVVREFLRGLFEADGWVSKTGGTVKFFSKSFDFGRDVQLLLLAFGIYASNRRVVKVAGGREYPGCEMTLFSFEAQKFLRDIGFVSQRKRSRKWTPRKAGRKPKQVDGKDTVVSITDAGEAEVFDLQISAEPVFSAGGILVHNCFLTSGNARFDSDGVARMAGACNLFPEPKYGILEMPDGAEAPVFIETSRAEAWLRVWEKPAETRRYIGAADFMTGEQVVGSRRESDCHAWGFGRARYTDADNTDHDAMLVAATMPDDRTRDLDIVAERIALTAKWYGGCPVAPEVNNSHGIVELLRGHGCNVWCRKKAGVGKTVLVPGIQTTTGSKRQMIGELAAMIREQELDVRCPRALAELRTFITHPDGTEAAADGEHDDWVMFLAFLAHVLPAAVTYEPLETKLAREQRRRNHYSGFGRGSRGLIAEYT